MAHNNPYELMISLELDDELTQAEKMDLADYLSANPESADLQRRMQVVDAMFSKSPAVSPPRNFAANVMARIEVMENTRRWYPWVLAILVVSSLLAAVSIAAPVLFFSSGLRETILSWPFVAVAVNELFEVWSVVQGGVDFVLSVFRDWFTYIFSEPAALAIVLIALVGASTWIGLREAIKLNRLAAAGQQI